eukprot:TRINITY_DN18393_c0_g1_i1.p3 TRINITY_DN18393_c0_g1~~TRINITY_DN18393_c0_g1_i1.p3  ORF type:complete len:166 (+),score=47.02 TRINITY_DN18393_c0_g1_i1:92-589(+)
MDGEDTASYRWTRSAGEQRPSTTSSTESIPLSEWGDFLTDIRTELIEQCGAAGQVSRQQLASIFNGMGLDISDVMLGGLWASDEDAGGAAAADGKDVPETLSVHEIIAHIGHRAQLRTPSSDTASNPASRPSSNTKSRSKLKTPGGGAATASAASWWGHPTADRS